MTTINVYMIGTRGGPRLTIETEPYAAAQTLLADFERDGARNFRQVKFSAEKVEELSRWMVPMEWKAAYWVAAVNTSTRLQYPDRGESVTIEVVQANLDDLLVSAKRIESEVAKVENCPTPPRHDCAGHRDGCREIVRTPGAYCPTCQHDTY